MAYTEFSLFPTYNLNVDLAKDTFRKVGSALDIHDYRRAAEYASATLDHIKQLLLITVLDHRAYALGRQGKFDDAVKDAQDMISCKPTLATGYIRLGDLYQMQGNQVRAVDAYEIGLQNVSPHDPCYGHMVKAKTSAKKRIDIRVDFIRVLPVEIVDDIITLLPKEFKSVCLSVSSDWKQKILGCAKLWKVLTSDDNPSARALPYIATHVEDMTISTTDPQIWRRQMVCMRNGNFNTIRALHLTATTTKHMDASMIGSLASAFHQMNKTLATLVIHFHKTGGVMALGKLLYILPNLRHLVYITAHPLTDVIGEGPSIRAHHSLVDIKLKSPFITEAIAPLLRQCHQVQRLVLDGCSTDVLDIVDTNCPKLRIFGYNPSNNEVPSLDSSDNQSSFGLRELYTKNGGDPVAAEAILPLIRRNMTTLETVYMNIVAWGTEGLSATFADLKLSKVTKLTFWGDAHGIVQPLIMRSISACTVLEYMSVVGSHDIPGLVNTLMALPRLDCLALSYTSTWVGSADLERLFRLYAVDNWSGQAFTSVRLRYCGAITDEVLAALSSIRTLKDVTLTNLRNVSTVGISNFLRRLGSSMTDIYLNELECITDSELMILSLTSNLRNVHLEQLKNVTDTGVMKLVDEAPSLRRLTLKKCTSITRGAIDYAELKLRKVVVLE